MSPTHTRSVAAVVGAATAGVAASAVLFLGAGTAHAVQDVSERGAIAIIDNLPTPRDCGNCFNPQPDPPGYPDPSSRSPLIGNPNEALIGNPNDAELGSPDTAPSPSQARTGQ